jgi:hypothetical protein
MTSPLQILLQKRFPKNFILRKPFPGALLISGFFFFFSVLYKPFHFHGAQSLSFGITFTLYILILFIPVFGCLMLLKRVDYFSNEAEWTLIKEILSILIVLFCSGVTLYFAGFIMEGSAGRWNLTTFLGSLKYASLIVMIPVIFFTISNYRYLFPHDILQYYNQSNNTSSLTETENVVRISSRLKKEELSFHPAQFIYAESDGNYVVFHLFMDGRHIKKTIRNSINDIEQQLSSIPNVLRIHRAFIVNLKKVESKKGNTLGYSLKLSGPENEIPVSRNHTKKFDKQMKQFG